MVIKNILKALFEIFTINGSTKRDDTKRKTDFNKIKKASWINLEIITDFSGELCQEQTFHHQGKFVIEGIRQPVKSVIC